MNGKRYIHALAGLLADSLLAEQRSQIVPSGWMESVTSAEAKAAYVSRLAAGVRQETAKGDLSSPLQSVFSNIGHEGTIPAKVYWPQAPLKLDDGVVMPGPQARMSPDTWKDFLEKARELKSIYEGATDDHLPLFIENLALLMQKYLWCLPSSYSNILPDVSLYDQSRMAAALAAAMAEQKAGQPIAQLVGGDLSGVQKFIYTITSSGATSALRGRSFYLQLLTDSTARFILRKLELPITSLVYAGGGNFYLLAPAGLDLKPLREYVSRVLLYHHSGDLYLAIAAMDLQESDFFDGEISNRWQALTDRLNRIKLQPFTKLGDGLKTLFEPQGHGGNEDLQCQVCGLEHPRTEMEKMDDPQRAGKRKCPPCVSYEDSLGKDLRKARYLLYESVAEAALPAGTPVPGTWDAVLAHFGARVTLSEDLPKTDAGESVLFALDDEAEKALKPTKTQAVGRRFIVNVTPTITQAEIDQLRDVVEDLPRSESVKPYDVMEHQAQGIKRLAVMRMDVDNLSRIFSSGFGKQASLSRIGALSFAVSLFFEGWVGKLAEDMNVRDRSEGRGERLYSIYSGGDDLFFVGAWDAVIELTRQIRADLGRYAGHHPSVHASAGVALMGGKYPLYQAAQDAGKAEEDAKDHEWFDQAGESHKKDSITFLGQTMPWAQFGLEACHDSKPQTVHAFAHKLEESMQADNAPKALLGLLLRLQGQYDEKARERSRKGLDVTQERKPQALWGPWNWLSVYYLKRMRARSDESFQKVLDDILNLFENQFASIQWIGLAARWAQLKLRK